MECVAWGCFTAWVRPADSLSGAQQGRHCPSSSSLYCCWCDQHVIIERESEREADKRLGWSCALAVLRRGKKRFCCWSQIHFKGLWLFIICDSFLSTKSCTHKVLNFEVIVLMRSVTLLFSLQHNVTRLHSRAVNATHFNGCFVNLLYGELNICPLWRKNNKRARQKELAKL